MRCIKACQADDVSCALNPVHLITHSFLSLPTFRDLGEPEGKTKWNNSELLEAAFSEKAVCVALIAMLNNCTSSMDKIACYSVHVCLCS